MFTSKTVGRVLAPLVFALWATCAQASTVNNILDAGTRLYNQGHYKEAVTLFRRAASSDPGDATVHFYLANALSWLGEKEQALEEYGLSSYLDPSGPATAYCRQLITTRAAQTAANTLGNSRFLASSFDQRNCLDDDSISRSMQIIQSQANFEKTKQHLQAEDGANNMWRQADTETRRLEATAQADIQDALTPPSTTSGHGSIFWDPIAAQKRADAIRQNADSAKAMSFKFAQSRTDVYRQIERTRQAELDQVAANLQGQMEKPVIADGVRLLPVGTNLYVRNYGSGQSTPVSGGGSDKDPGKALIGDKAKANSLDAIAGNRAREIKDNFAKGQSGKTIEDLRYTKEVKAKKLD